MTSSGRSSPAPAAGSSPRWLHRIRGAASPAKGRLLFFPPAGSSASSAWALADAVSEEWALWGVQYPARGSRLREPPARSIREIASACPPAVLGGSSRTLLFGHSFGALVAYDVAQLLETAGSPAAGLLVSGTSAPGTALAELSPDDLSDDSLIASLNRQGGTLPELLANDELMRLVLPALRADLSLGRGYVDDHGRRLATPVAALGGRHDRVVSRRQLRTWRKVTESWLGEQLGEGDHFFYLQDPSVLADVMSRHWPLDGDGAGGGGATTRVRTCGVTGGVR